MVLKLVYDSMKNAPGKIEMAYFCLFQKFKILFKIFEQMSYLLNFSLNVETTLSDNIIHFSFYLNIDNTFP